MVWAILISILLLSTGLILYFLNFHSSLSSDPSQWAYFSSYLSTFVSLSTLILLGPISYFTYKATVAFNNLQSTPLLDFTVRYKSGEDATDDWYLINCSHAVARNISVRFSIDGQHFSKWVACYALIGGTEIELPWLKFASRIEVYYTDAFSDSYFLMVYENLASEYDIISKSNFHNVLTNRLNHANLIIKLTEFNSIKKQDYHHILTNSIDYVNHFAIPVGLFHVG